jgi:dihydrofolate reductase
MEFMDASPQELLERLEARGYKRILLVGGQVNTQFWAADLVDQAFVTVEPLVFGQGRNLLDGADLDVRLQLQSVKQLNKRGTLLLHYLVDKG